MASAKAFDGLPSFPDDVPTVDMTVVELAKLRAGDAAAHRSLLEACEGLGFFQLRLDGDPVGEAITNEIDKLFEAMPNIMTLPDEVKQKYLHDAPRSFFGFKPRGVARTETDEPDRFEWFNLGQDGLMGNSDLQPLPEQILTRRELFTSFLRNGQSIVSTICEALAQQLGLPSATFGSLQPLDKPSGTVVRMIRAFASPKLADLRTSMTHHTDFGTVTLLANVIGGLQILTPGQLPSSPDAWRYVRPRPGCLIVNLGDAMVQWTGHRLRSNVHRISHAPGEQRFVERYSLALLVRPERDASMRPLTGVLSDDDTTDTHDLTAWEWEVKQAMSLSRGDAIVQSKGGRTEVHAV